MTEKIYTKKKLGMYVLIGVLAAYVLAFFGVIIGAALSAYAFLGGFFVFVQVPRVKALDGRNA